jgi:hypothetical protein
VQADADAADLGGDGVLKKAGIIVRSIHGAIQKWYVFFGSI